MKKNYDKNNSKSIQGGSPYERLLELYYEKTLGGNNGDFDEGAIEEKKPLKKNKEMCENGLIQKNKRKISE